MKLFLASVLVSLAALSHAQNGAQQDPDLLVVKFSCGKYETGSGMIRSVQDPSSTMNSPIHINTQPKKEEPQELKNRRDMLERRLEMRNAEINASLSKQKGASLYFYRLQVKNSSPKIVKSFAWEYQPTATPDPLDRQFYCAIRAKPNERKELELFSPLAPSWVVDATHAGGKVGKDSSATVIINQIEYTDGTVWTRKGWNPKTFSEEWVSKTEPGKCIGL